MYGAVIWVPVRDSLRPYPVKYQKPVSYGIRRIEFDSILTDQAKDAGAEDLDSTPALKVYRQKKEKL